MALIICKECGKKFSDLANACPNCACPVSAMKKNNSVAKKSLIICDACGKEISDKASKCPNCGNPIQREKEISSFEDMSFKEIWYNGKQQKKLIELMKKDNVYPNGERSAVFVFLFLFMFFIFLFVINTRIIWLIFSIICLIVGALLGIDTRMKMHDYYNEYVNKKK